MVDFENGRNSLMDQNARSAIIESPKVFMKNLMKKYQIPTAGYAVFSDAQEAQPHSHTEPLSNGL